MEVRIISIPPGEAPEDVRRAWVGLVLPLVPGVRGPFESEGVGVLTGSRGLLGRLWHRLAGGRTRGTTYLVPVDTAISVLEKASPAAASWWRENTPHMIGRGKIFGFDAAVCELLPGRPKPRIVSGLEEGSPFVVLDTGNGMTTVMDRMAYEYMYGDVQKPVPSQRALDEMLAKVVRIKVWAGGMMRDNPTTQELLADEADPQAVEAFRRAFRISEDPTTFNHCMCLGQPTIELLDTSGRRVGTLGMQHGHAVRWDYWKHDAQLLDGQLIHGWLAEHGVPAECTR